MVRDRVRPFSGHLPSRAVLLRRLVRPGAGLPEQHSSRDACLKCQLFSVRPDERDHRRAAELRVPASRK